VTLTLITDTWVAIPICLLIWATHTPSLVSIRQSKLKLLSKKWISNLKDSDLDLNHRHLGSNPNLPFNMSYPHTKFSVNRPKQTRMIEPKHKLDAARLAVRLPGHEPTRQPKQYKNHSAKFQALPNALDFLWSCKGLWRGFLLCFLGLTIYTPFFNID